ncbi:outer membrane protein assembly factor BamB family protein [Streptomyces fructofermentans]|uniref:outer membrane protein assembly factor BamB family protein n=1 Tax=Streptomyces fructofermentans TaxID=152141 RepID=UPI0033C56DCF
MAIPFRIDRVLGDRPFAEVGDPALAVDDERRGLLAVAGAHAAVAGMHGFGSTATVGVYGTDDLACRALLRARHPVHAMAFHPTLPLLAVGTGSYDGGYFFEGELLLLDLERGTSTSLIEHELGRQVLGLEWLGEQELRVLTAPPDDWQDKDAWVEGHVAVVRRPDWRAVLPRSITGYDLAGPRVAAPRSDGREDARRAVSSLSTDWDPRSNVRAVEELSDGRIMATLDGIRLESWLPSGQRQWAVPDDTGGGDLVIAPDERSAWVALLRPEWEKRPQAVVRLSLDDGAQLDHLTPPTPVSLVRCSDGLPALAPAGPTGERSGLRIRRGSRIYFRETVRKKGEGNPARMGTWLAAADLEAMPAAERPREPTEAEARRLFPYSWTPGESHMAGPGAETADGGLVHAGTVHHSHGLQPGGSFVARREPTNGEPTWAFRTDRKATGLDCDAKTVYVTYDDGEIVALDLHDGTVRWRRHLAVAAVPAVPTALTVAEPGRLLIGTSDGRLLDCSTA